MVSWNKVVRSQKRRRATHSFSSLINWLSSLINWLSSLINLPSSLINRLRELQLGAVLGKVNNQGPRRVKN